MKLKQLKLVKVVSGFNLGTKAKNLFFILVNHTPKNSVNETEPVYLTATQLIELIGKNVKQTDSVLKPRYERLPNGVYRRAYQKNFDVVEIKACSVDINTNCLVTYNKFIDSLAEYGFILDEFNTAKSNDHLLSVMVQEVEDGKIYRILLLKLS